MWATGVSSNPKNFGVKIISHEKTQAHLDVSIAFGRWKAGQRTDHVQEQAIDTEATFWRYDLLRTINIVKTLAMTSLALRGHHEHAGDSDCHGGNFVALNRQGPQMRYCLWAPECDATPLAAVHMCSAWSAPRYHGRGEVQAVHNEVWQASQRHMHHL